MNVLIIGSGAREHAIGWKISQSPLLTNLWVVPGNAGTEKISETISFNLFGTTVRNENFKPPLLGSTIEKWHEFFRVVELLVRVKEVNLVVVQFEDAIYHGIEDWFHVRGFKIFAASNSASILEWSKIFPQGYLKEISIEGYKLLGKPGDTSFFENNEIPHARGFGFRKLPEDLAEKLPDEFRVVKASGVRGGKGVSVATLAAEVVERSKEILEDPLFQRGEVGVVVQEKLEGWEVSAHAFSDGTTISMMPFARDFKKLGEGDTGENTGGVACISGPDIVTPKLAQQIETQIVAKTVSAMKRIGRKLVSVVYPGLFMTKDGPKVIEYNIRFGDPETQVILSKLKTDLLEIMLACIDGRLDEIEIEWDEDYAFCLVLCSGGYPDTDKMILGFPITGLDQVPEDVLVFHAGTATSYLDEIITSGGRVLSVVGKGKTLQEAKDRVYHAIKYIHFDKMDFRRDLA